jgi:hypothetical protein
MRAGIERRFNRQANCEQLVLLVLDPAVPSGQLEAALRSRRQWARMVKRGAATLRQPEYQVGCSCRCRSSSCVVKAPTKALLRGRQLRGRP